MSTFNIQTRISPWLSVIEMHAKELKVHEAGYLALQEAVNKLIDSLGAACSSGEDTTEARAEYDAAKLEHQAAHDRWVELSRAIKLCSLEVPADYRAKVLADNLAKYGVTAELWRF